MENLVVLYSALRNELQLLRKGVAKIADSHANRLMEEWTRKPEAMQILGISARTLARLTKDGTLPFSKVRGIVFLKTSDIERLLNENYNNRN